ncbi:DUF1491 family protein [Rhizobiaceae bacterium BDR2-2]|uniref:DUF1491 family protein n=1 Tax=Ectorhizobium quercum TaxID=2965071 RepID=A0AAE3SXH0_9HYPH|nr:DUF1491 family protein [Ectorhizobium quercum]MCX8998485.1 DUF1491 family protein [Ectorhizobium quercum]
MRVKSALFVSALIRRAFALGGFAAVDRKGAEEAGAIFVRLIGRDGRVTLYAPAPQSVAAEQEDAIADDRLFECRLKDAGYDEALALLERECRFDPDLWIVDLELDGIGDLLPVAAGE